MFEGDTMNRNFLLSLLRRFGRTEKCVPYCTVIPANECCTEWGAMSDVNHSPKVWKVECGDRENDVQRKKDVEQA